MNATFDVMIEEFLQEFFREHPVRASALGVDGYYHLLGDFGQEAFERREDSWEQWRARFEGIDESTLDGDQLVDRVLIMSQLRGQSVMRDWEVHKRNPDVYLSPGLDGVFSLFLKRPLSESELVDAAEARLEGVGDVIDEGIRNLDPGLVPEVFLNRARGQCQTGVTYFRDLLAVEVQAGPLRSRLESAGAKAALAYEKFLGFLDELEAGARGEWAIGEERYSQLLQEKEMLGYDASEMLERGTAALERLDAEIAEFSSEHFGEQDFREVSRRLREEAHPVSHDAMRDEYERWSESAREFLHAKKLVTMPEGEECHVVPSPVFQRPLLAVPSYSAPPPFRPSLVGHFFVPYPPEGMAEDKIQERLKARSMYAFATTSVHEAYPGHHWHLITMQSNPRKIRRVFRTSYFTEGWALYAEKMMDEQGFYDDPRPRFYVIGSRRARAARIVVDVSLHIGKMSIPEAEDFLERRGGFSRPIVEAEVGRYCTWPTQASSYFTGAEEIQRMRDRWFKEGRGDLRTFHDRIAGSGGLPLGLAERALFA